MVTMTIVTHDRDPSYAWYVTQLHMTGTLVAHGDSDPSYTL